MAQVYQTYATDLARHVAAGMAVPTDKGTFSVGRSLSPFDLDDIVQETFVRAFKPEARQAYDGVRPYLGYLSGIARNLIVDRGRKDARWGQWLVDDAEQTAASNHSGGELSPEGKVLATELQQIYTTFVASLGPDNRSLWTLRFEQQQARRVVQDATGLSAMQVRTREKQLRRELAQRLDAAGYSHLAGSTVTTLLLLIAMGAS